MAPDRRARVSGDGVLPADSLRIAQALSALRANENGCFRGLVVAGIRSPLRVIPWSEVAFCTFEIALDGRSALRVVARQAPDLVLLDLDLPDLPGLVVLRRIRGLTPEIPVLVMARRPDLRSTIQVADLGVTGYVTPPIDGPKLLRRLRSLMRSAPRSRPLLPTPTPRALALGEATLTELQAPNGAQQSVMALAATLGVSPRRLRRAVREAYGVSIKPLMLRIRVQRALARVQETDEPIKAIAATLGFYDAAHLTNTVRRLTGAPPRRYRECGRVGLRRWLRAAWVAEQAFNSRAPDA